MKIYNDAEFLLRDIFKAGEKGRICKVMKITRLKILQYFEEKEKTEYLREGKK